MRRNEAAFGDIALVPRPLNGAATRDLSVELVRPPPVDARADRADRPQRTVLARRRDRRRARGDRGGNVRLLPQPRLRLHDRGRWRPTGAAPRWMQIFVYRDRGFTREFVERAQAAGYDALVLTIDNQLLGNRERDIRNGFTIPPRFGARDLAAMAGKLPWLMRMGRELPRITFANYVRPGESSDIGDIAKRMGAMLDPGLSWRDVDWLRGSVEGAAAAEGRAASGRGAPKRRRVASTALIVSNHGGRQLDGAIASTRRAAGDRRRRRTAQSRCCSTAACAAAPMSSRRWRSARPPA